MLLRPKNAVMAVIGTLVGWCSAGGGLDAGALLCVLTPSLVLMGGNAINDYFDVEIDRVNRPHRPIPSGLVSRREALVAYLFLSAAGVAIAYAFGPLPVGIALFFSASWYAYGARIKATGLPGNALVSLGVAFTMIYGALCYGPLPPKVLSYSLVAFSVNLVREIVKCVEDLPGDSRVGLKTLPIRVGLPGTRLLLSALFLISGCVALAPIFLGLASLPYSIGGPIAVSILAYSAVTKLPKLDPTFARPMSAEVKLAMFVGVLSMLLDSTL